MSTSIGINIIDHIKNTLLYNISIFCAVTSMILLSFHLTVYDKNMSFFLESELYPLIWPIYSKS